jgi:branched-chain amino acid transport system substrate-binding protein
MLILATVAAAAIAIGTSLSVSGAEATNGLPMQNAVVLAVEQANARAHRAKFRVIALDDSVGGIHNPQQGATNIRTLGADPSVVAVVGPVDSNVAVAEIPIAQALGLPIVSGSATNPDLTKKLRSGVFFRVVATDDLQGAAASIAAHDVLHLRRIAVVDDNETFGRAIATIFAAAFARAGGTITARDHLTPQQQDFHALLTAIAATHPDAIFFGGTPATGGVLLRKQMRASGLDPAKVAFLGGDPLSDPGFPAGVGADADNAYYTTAAPNAEKLPAARAFLAAYRKRFGVAADAYAATTYAATQTILAAVARAQHGADAPPTRAAVRAALAATTNVPTVLGPITYDANGDTVHPIASIFAIRNGMPTFLTQVDARK